MKATATKMLISIQALMVATALILEYLSGRYMGIMRSVLYRNRLWEATWPMESIAFIISAILLTIAALCAGRVLTALFKRRGAHPRRLFPTVILALMMSGAAAFIQLYDATDFRTYYIAILLFLLVAVLQAIHVVLSLRGSTTRKN